MKVVILGTGATSGTLANAGGVDGFVNRLGSERKGWKRSYAALRRALEDCGDLSDQVGLDVLWTRLDYRSKFSSILGPDYGAKAAIQVRKAVADAYSFRKQIAKVCRTSNDFTLRRVLSGLGPGDALISFNWDTLAESILMNLIGKRVIQAPHRSVHLGVRLIKPHGSLSWVHSRKHGVVYRQGSSPRLVPMRSVEIVAPASGAFVQPLLLGAVPIKSELLKEVQRGQARLYKTIAAQWSEAVNAIVHATSIEVVGYRFPPEDVYGRFLFREAVRRRPHKVTFPTIRYYALRRDRKAFEQAFREVFGEDVAYDYSGAVGPALPAS